MAPNRPDTERADILIDGDTIDAVGENLDATGAEIIDVPGRIIMPGLVNARVGSFHATSRIRTRVPPIT